MKTCMKSLLLLGLLPLAHGRGNSRPQLGLGGETSIQQHTVGNGEASTRTRPMGSLEDLRGGVGQEHNHKKIYMDALLEIEFFEGMGREPTQGEIKALERKTEDWLKDLFASDTSSASFQIQKVNPTYDAANQDHWSVTFSAFVKGGDELTKQEIANIINEADYEAYITDYIWKTSPEMDNEFYQTHEVVCQGWFLHSSD